MSTKQMSRKERGKVPITFDLDAADALQLREIAQLQEMPVSQFMRRLVRRLLREDRQP
jgi:hypothetical protein